MARAYLGLGSNIERERHVREGLAALAARFGQLTVSPVYESAAIGFDGQPFFNLVVAIETELEPHALDRALKHVERLHGRVNGAPRFSSRTLDIDLLLYDDRVIHSEGLELPRPDILIYAFVLKPLADVAGELIHPLLRRRINAIWRDFHDPAQSLRQVSIDPAGAPHTRCLP